MRLKIRRRSGRSWIVLLFLLVSFFVLGAAGIPVSAIAAVRAAVLFVVAKRGHAINTGKSAAQGATARSDFLAGMYMVVYGLRNAGLTEYLCRTQYAGRQKVSITSVRYRLPDSFLSSVMNNMPTVLIGALSIDGSVHDSRRQRADDLCQCD